MWKMVYASFLAFFLTVGPAWAGTYTLTLTPRQERALAWAVAQQVPVVTAQALLQEVLDNALAQFQGRMRGSEEADFSAKLATLTPAQRAAICVTVPLTVCP